MTLPAATSDKPASGIGELREYARRAGLPDSVPIMDVANGGGINAYYMKGGYVCFLFFCGTVPEHIGLALPDDWPLEWKVAVLTHEIAHYHQWKDGVVASGIPVAIEWDADARAIDRMCEWGWSGNQVQAEALTALWKSQPAWRRDEASESHGGLPWRIRAAYEHRCGGHRSPESV